MATRLYFHSESYSTLGGGPTSPQSTQNVAGSTATGANTLRQMGLAPGVSQSALTVTTLASNSPQKSFMGYYATPQVTNRCVISGSVKINIGDTQSNLNSAFVPNIACVYAWNPNSGGSIRGFVTNVGGPPPGPSPASVVNTPELSILRYNVSASDTPNQFAEPLTVESGDIIVCEIWAAFTQSMATSYTGTTFFNGQNSFNDREGSSALNYASYIEFSDDISFYTNRVEKTIKVPVNFGAVADVIDNTATTIGSPTIFIPENNADNPIKITDAMLYIAAQDTSTATGATLGTFTAACVLNTVGAVTSSVTVLSSLTNTGENWGGVFGPIDFTQNFNSFFGTDTSRACSVRVTLDTTTGTGLNLRGVYGYFEITYEYTPPANDIRIQTIPIPYDSLTTTLPTTSTLFATSPQLSGSGGYLQTYGPTTIRHRWLEIKGNCTLAAGVTNFGISASLGGGATVILPQRVATFASDTYQLYQLDMTGLSTTTSNAINIWSSLATRFANLVVTEWVSFEYTGSSATNVLNYQEISFAAQTPLAISANTPDVIYTKLQIPERGDIILRNSALELNYSCEGAATVQVATGLTGSFRGYAQTSTVTCGQFGLQHRFDSASAGGTAITLTRGENTLVTRLYRSSGTTAVSNITGVIKLVYQSGKDIDFGVDYHSATRAHLVRSLDFTTQTDDFATTASLSIPQSFYNIHDYAINYNMWQFGAAGVRIPIMVQANLGAGPSASYQTWYKDDIASDGELSFTSVVMPVPNYQLNPLYPLTTRPSFNPRTQRSLRFTSAYGSRQGIRSIVTYNGALRTVTGNLTTNDTLTNIHLKLYRVDTMELLQQQLVPPNTTSYTFYVNNPQTVQYLVTAYQNEIYNGMSRIESPSPQGQPTQFPIDLNPPGGEFFF